MSTTEDLDAPATVTLQRRIEWIDTDAAGIYHWTTAFRLVEAAEAAMHTCLGIADVTFGRAPRVAWPSASISADRSGSTTSPRCS